MAGKFVEYSSSEDDSENSYDEGGSGTGNLPGSSRIPKNLKSSNEGALSKNYLLKRRFTAEMVFPLGSVNSPEVIWQPNSDELFKSRFHDAERGSTRYGNLDKVLVTKLEVVKTTNFTPFNVLVQVDPITDGHGYANSRDSKQLTRGAHLMQAMRQENYEGRNIPIYTPPAYNDVIVNRFANKKRTEPQQIRKGEGKNARRVWIVPVDDDIWKTVIVSAEHRLGPRLNIARNDGNFEIHPEDFDFIQQIYEDKVLKAIPNQSLSSERLKVVFKKLDGTPWSDLNSIPMFLGDQVMNQSSTTKLAATNVSMMVEFYIEYYLFDLEDGNRGRH